MKRFMLEICVDSVESALAAVEGGAKRLELCSNLVIGGTTPSISLYEAIRNYTDIPIHILIRPRFGDFCYSAYEYQVIKEEVRSFQEAGANGIVIGELLPDGSLHVEHLQELKTLAKNMSVTCHRAFDLCRDPYKSLEQAIALGFDTILTSGQANTCIEGVEVLKKLMEQSRGRISILASSGVTSQNIPILYEKAKLREFHLSSKIIKDSLMEYRKEGVNMGIPMASEYEIFQTDPDQVQRAKRVLEILEAQEE